MHDLGQTAISQQILGMDFSSILELLSKYPLVTRKLLLIRPLRTDHPEEVAINAVADALSSEAKKMSWDVKDLKGDAATPSNIHDAINNWKADFVAYYGHSYGSNIPGQENGQLKVAISAGNASLLSGRTASITACHTMTAVGVPAVKAGAIGYLGYKVSFTGVWGPLLDHDFREATNAANLALLSGEKYTEARQKGSKRWKKFYSDLVAYMKKNPKAKIDPTIPGGLLANANGLDYMGDPDAVARPIGLFLSTP